jgi:hypothetical protein
VERKATIILDKGAAFHSEMSKPHACVIAKKFSSAYIKNVYNDAIILKNIKS